MTLRHACQFNDETLAELESLIKGTSETHYLAHLSVHSSPVGTHVRHIIEFYQCLLTGLGSGEVDYDTRAREPALESSPSVALESIKDIRQQLACLGDNANPEVLELASCTGRGGEKSSTNSNLTRELLFLQSHATHHLAVIALLLENAGVDAPKSLGFAASTRVYK